MLFAQQIGHLTFSSVPLGYFENLKKPLNIVVHFPCQKL